MKPDQLELFAPTQTQPATKPAAKPAPQTKDDSHATAAQANTLLAEIARHDIAYYRDSAPTITDDDYDSLTRRYDEIRNNNPALDLPERDVGTQPDPDTAIRHLTPMLSLDNAHTIEDIARFIADANRLCKTPNAPYAVEYKGDGVSVNLIYRNGLLTTGATRGNKTAGENLTKSLLAMADIPLTLPSGSPPVIEIRAEIVITTANMEIANEWRVQDGKKPFANPRNAVGGLLRTHNPPNRKIIDVLVHGIGHCSKDAWKTQQDALRTLSTWGFTKIEELGAITTADELEPLIRQTIEKRDGLPYEIDGLVIKLASLRDRPEALSTRSPKWAIAFKFPPQERETTLHKIDIQVGRTGVLTPVAKLEPTRLGGTTIENATLHNEAFVQKLGLYPGCRVRLQRGADVIPKIVGRVPEREPNEPVRWTMMETCPACGSPTILRAVSTPNTQERLAIDPGISQSKTYCSNSMNCPATIVSRLEYICSKSVLDIEGLSQQTIELLCEAGLINEAADIFGLPDHEAEIASLQGMGTRSARKLTDTIRKRRSSIPLDKIIASLCIRECGRTASRTIAEHFRSIPTLLEAMKTSKPHEPGYQHFIALENIGPLMIAEINTWASNEANMQSLTRLLDTVTVQLPPPLKNISSPVKNKTVVFTGSLQIGTRSEAEAMARELGCKTSSSVSAKTDILVVGENGGKKHQQAETLNRSGAYIRIMSEADWVSITS